MSKIKTVEIKYDGLQYSQRHPITTSEVKKNVCSSLCNISYYIDHCR